MDKLRLFTLRHELLKISCLQTAFVAETTVTEGKWLKEQLTVVKLRMFLLGTRMPIISRTKGQYLMLVKIFIRNKVSK
jgi:hypothetical protein